MTQQVKELTVKEQAAALAKENRHGDASIQQVYWFPDKNNREVRLVEITDDVPKTEDKDVHPFYFRPQPADGLPFPSGIALIRPDEFGNLILPAGWGEWTDATEL